MEAREFAALKWRWLDQVFDHAGVTPAAFKLAYVIATKYLNREKLCAWPLQETLAKDLGVTVRTVKTLTDLLVGCGLLNVQAGHPKRYRLDFPAFPETAIRKLVSGCATIEAPEIGNLTQSNPKSDAPKPEAGFRLHIEPFEELFEEPSQRESAPRPTLLPADWEPLASDVRFARLRGLEGEDLEREVRRFRNHYQGVKGDQRSRNWSLTFQNWIETSLDYRARNSGSDRLPKIGGLWANGG
jgi:hypothetical protein